MPYRCLFLIAVAMASSGCETGPALYSTTGTVTYDSKPVEGAAVAFIPEVEGGMPGIATTDASGKFTILTDGKPGASPGKYKVTVIKMEARTGTATAADMKSMQTGAPPPKALLPIKYSAPQTTDLRADVGTDAAKNVFPLDLKN